MARRRPAALDDHSRKPNRLHSSAPLEGCKGAITCPHFPKCSHIAAFLPRHIGGYILTLEIGINILGMNSAEYEKRVDYLLSAIRGRHSSKPIAVITVFPCHASFLTTPSENFHAFNAILRRLAEKYNAALIEGTELLDDLTCLSADLVHPGVFGHAVMGLNLAEKLRALI